MADVGGFAVAAGQRTQPSRMSSDHSGISGVCMMSNKWKEEQHPSFIDFISTFLSANSFRLNIVPIAPDFIFNCGGVSVAFIFVTTWDCAAAPLIYSRVLKLKEQFAHLYAVVTLPAREQNDSFVRSYFKSGVDIGRPAFVPVLDLEMGFEKIVKIAHTRGVCKQHDIITRMKAERQQAVQGIDPFLRVITSIPSIDKHDANSVDTRISYIGLFYCLSSVLLIFSLGIGPSNFISKMSTGKPEVYSGFKLQSETSEKRQFPLVESI